MLEKFLPLLPIFLIVIFLLIFLWLFPLRQKSRSAKILKHFNGDFSWPLGDLKIGYAGLQFRISRISRGAGINNSVGGSFPLLWAYVEKTDKFILGNSNSEKYTIGKFLILPPHEKLRIGNLSILAGSTSISLREKVRELSRDQGFNKVCSLLFTEEFSHFSISSEIHFCGIIPKKKFVLKYMGLPEKIYSSPEDLESYIQCLKECCSLLGFKMAPATCH